MFRITLSRLPPAIIRPSWPLFRSIVRHLRAARAEKYNALEKIDTRRQRRRGVGGLAVVGMHLVLPDDRGPGVLDDDAALEVAHRKTGYFDVGHARDVDADPPSAIDSRPIEDGGNPAQLDAWFADDHPLGMRSAMHLHDFACRSGVQRRADGQEIGRRATDDVAERVDGAVA